MNEIQRLLAQISLLEAATRLKDNQLAHATQNLDRAMAAADRFRAERDSAREGLFAEMKERDRLRDLAAERSVRDEISGTDFIAGLRGAPV